MEPFIGQLMCVGFNFAPNGWAKCDGQLLAIASNTALFSLLGTIYGGDGRTTFALPDLRGRIPLHNGTGPGLPNYNQGSRAGLPTSQLVTANLPAHNHTGVLNVSTANADASTPASGSTIAVPGTVSGRAFNATLGFNSATPNVGINSVTTNNTGSNTPFTTQSPYLTLNWVIALVGIFPSRS